MAAGNAHGGMPMGLPKTVALVGLMGAGKTAIGKRLAARLGLPFVDADAAIEKAADCTIEEYFSRHGEADFRRKERLVISRLLTEPAQILATGGGAFIDPQTRALMRAQALSVWLRADLDVLVARTARRTNRPLLKHGDPREVLGRLMALRYPIYAEADLIVDSEDGPVEEMVERVLLAIERQIGRELVKHPPAPDLHPETTKAKP
ncbi:MAG: shikimate kinase [Rhodospirillaceae bacterium]